MHRKSTPFLSHTYIQNLILGIKLSVYAQLKETLKTNNIWDESFESLRVLHPISLLCSQYIFLRVLFGMNSECLVSKDTINFHACMWWWYRHALLLTCTLDCTISQGRMWVTCRGVHWVVIQGQKSMVNITRMHVMYLFWARYPFDMN